VLVAQDRPGKRGEVAISASSSYLGELSGSEATRNALHCRRVSRLSSAKSSIRSEDGGLSSSLTGK
jgi:hypothetical protein